MNPKTDVFFDLQGIVSSSDVSIKILSHNLIYR